MALNIENVEVEVLAERLVEAQRATKTETVRGALELRLALVAEASLGVAACRPRPEHRPAPRARLTRP